MHQTRSTHLIRPQEGYYVEDYFIKYKYLRFERREKNGCLHMDVQYYIHTIHKLQLMQTENLEKFA